VSAPQVVGDEADGGLFGGPRSARYRELQQSRQRRPQLSKLQRAPLLQQSQQAQLAAGGWPCRSWEWRRRVRSWRLGPLPCDPFVHPALCYMACVV
jgi:hypothetical protein